MRFVTSALVLCCLLVSVAVCVSAQNSAPSAQAERTYCFDVSRVSVRVDTGMYFGTTHWPKTDKEKGLWLPILRKYGIRVIREDIGLDRILSEKVCPDRKTFFGSIRDPRFVDSWDWSTANWMAEAKREGFRTMGIFCYMPKCLTANGSLPRKGDIAAWEAWGDVCAKAYRRLGNQMDYLEVFNEAHFFTKPDGTGYKRSVDADPDIFHYAERRLRPLTDKPILGGVTWVDCWAGSALDTLPFDARSKTHAPDYFSIHVYDTEPGAFFDRVDHTREILDATRKNLPAAHTAPWKNKPIWATEWNQYWKGKRYGMDWYGFALTEFLKRGVPNLIYCYNEFFDPKLPSQSKPWLLLVQCGLNSKAQMVLVHPETDTHQFTTSANSVTCTLPDGSIVVLATNTTASPVSTVWRLTGMARSFGKLQLRRWDAVGEGPELTTRDADQSSSLVVSGSACTIRYMLPPHSMTALKLIRR